MIGTGPLGPRDRLHFEMPSKILKLAEAKAEAAKIQFAISSRSGACQLNMSPASGFDYPHIRIKSRESTISVRSGERKRMRRCAICKGIFFRHREVGSRVKCPRVKCPTLKLDCLTDARTGGGVRGCSLLGTIDQQPYNRK